MKIQIEKIYSVTFEAEIPDDVATDDEARNLACAISARVGLDVNVRRLDSSIGDVDVDRVSTVYSKLVPGQDPEYDDDAEEWFDT